MMTSPFLLDVADLVAGAALAEDGVVVVVADDDVVILAVVAVSVTDGEASL